MNIFYTSSNPKAAALNLCTVHINKMIIESAQMLSTAHHILSPNDMPDNLMKPTHKNHPSNVWVRKSVSNYAWLCNHLYQLLMLYTENTGKVHKVTERMTSLVKAPIGISYTEGFTEPPRAMPDDLKEDQTISTEEAYKLYLDRKYHEWSTRERPMKIMFMYNKPDYVTVKDVQIFTS